MRKVAGGKRQAEGGTRAAEVRLPSHLKDHWLRASSSIALNLAEGCGKPTLADQARFFSIAMGSIRECQAIAQLEASAFSAADLDLLDHLAASVYKLIRCSRGG